MPKPALHVISLPHTSTTWEYSWCAYSQKALKLAIMMEKLGYKVYLYASTESDFPNTVPCVFAPKTAAVTYPNWTTDYFNQMNVKAIDAIDERIEDHDIICLTTGFPQKPIADAFPNHLVVEYGVGYEGVCSKYLVFESYAWMHAVQGFHAGLNNAKGEHVMNTQGRFYDAVIPNYFVPEQFPFGDGDGDYLLYIGRMIPLKGLQIAVDTSKRTGIPLLLAGQGDPPDYGTYLGVVGPEKRSELMGNARAVMVPSLYLEPFGGVNVEAQMCGTPVITTDWGAFPETVEQGVTGYRCHTMAEFCQAAEDVKGLNRSDIAVRAVDKYSCDSVSLLYDRYFERLGGLWGKGFDA